MNKRRLQNLLIAYSSNKISIQEYNELMDLVVLSNHDEELYTFMQKIWDSRPTGQPFSDLQSAMLYQRIIGDSRFDQQPIQKKKVAIKLWPRIAAAALILITLSVGLFFYLDDNSIGLGLSDFATHDVKPGGNNAVLTLANGQKIELTAAAAGKIAEQSGLSIQKTADGQIVYEVSHVKTKGKEEVGYNTIETPKGGQYQVNLPDGTKVWLNASSSLKFPTEFTGSDNRVVELRGEGYFEVAKVHGAANGRRAKERMPFLVRTNDQEVEVLGTHFNISSYADDAETRTTLVEGAVKVKRISIGANDDVIKTGIILKPGQQALLKAAQLNVKNVDTDAEVAWKNGYFIFKDEEMRSIMRKIARWYDVEVVFSKDFHNRSFEGSISRFKNVSEVLRKFELTGDIHFKIEERRIIVMP
ncbi:FecR family protein [Pedobacter nyackensis]|uniref:FecR family protein n=1 Tax=Pedobacter nyackensis TaxID=475255 RepID=A0A1W2ECL6_9SPHI|nr:FecR family protein [Pedobacter nyackensis]SMD07459.1 FecR family protein [Pedobacter nyackensis]